MSSRTPERLHSDGTIDIHCKKCGEFIYTTIYRGISTIVCNKCHYSKKTELETTPLELRPEEERLSLMEGIQLALVLSVEKTIEVLEGVSDILKPRDRLKVRGLMLCGCHTERGEDGGHRTVIVCANKTHAVGQLWEEGALKEIIDGQKKPPVKKRSAGLLNLKKPTKGKK